MGGYERIWFIDARSFIFGKQYFCCKIFPVVPRFDLTLVLTFHLLQGQLCYIVKRAKFKISSTVILVSKFLHVMSFLDNFDLHIFVVVGNGGQSCKHVVWVGGRRGAVRLLRVGQFYSRNCGANKQWDKWCPHRVLQECRVLADKTSNIICTCSFEDVSGDTRMLSWDHKVQVHFM